MLKGYLCALTITSISGYNWAIKRRSQYQNLILLDFLPFDSQANMRRILDLLHPVAVIFVKFDLWPNMIWETCKRKIPQYLISATLAPHSKRFSMALGRSAYRSIYNCFNGIFSVSEDDRKRFLATCPHHRAVINVGDTRFDSVLDRKNSIEPPSLPDFIKHHPTIVIGSCWSQDEQRIFPVLQEALDRFPDLVCIIAPHEVDAKYIAAIEQAFSNRRITRYTRLAEDTKQSFRIVLVDAVGYLSALYFYADIAYVGGGFSTGVHNVMEPSAMGVPAIFGPFYKNSPEAVDLLEHGKAFAIKDEAEFKSVLFRLLEDQEYRKKIGREAAYYIEQQAGASELCCRLIEEKLHESNQP